MKKLLTILLISFMVLCAVNTNVYAETFTEISDLNEYEVYVDANYDEYRKNNYELLRDRGRCTDRFSWEWCVAHGYSNNRPVGSSVRLTKRELDCVIKTYGSLAEGVIAGALTPAGIGIYYAAAQAAYRFWTCLY
ncbi:MAG: hypothetical protein MR283_05415 [Erysipelotrichaceae bacterium]|nr:hypothetical protein [Erysipelotrichaceae bacterium]MDY6034250.1 hypothetical protein [Bulleidia sp.]